MKNLSKYFIFIFFICLILVEFLALTPNSPKIIVNIWDKFNHFFAFSVLFILLKFGFINLKYSISALILLAFGIQVEIAQNFIPNREFSILDIVADFCGIICGIITVKLIYKFTNLHKFL